MIELVVFDMAGTTVDEGNVVYKTVREAINSAGYRFTQEQVQAAGAGKEKSQAIRDVLRLDGRPHGEDEVLQIFANFKQRLELAYAELNVQPHAGATELFEALHGRGIKVALNTGYDRSTAESLIDKIGWTIGNEIDVLVTASDVENGRPAPDMIHKAMVATRMRAANAVVKVGDSAIDIEEGHNANCGLTFGITTGAQTRSQLLSANPTAVIDHLSEVLKQIDES